MQERRLPGTQQVPVGPAVEAGREGLARVAVLLLAVGQEVDRRAVLEAARVGVALEYQGASKSGSIRRACSKSSASSSAGGAP